VSAQRHERRALWTKRAVRAARFLLVAGLLFALWLFLRGRDTVTLDPKDSSMDPPFPAESTLLVERLDADAPLERGTYVLYRVRGQPFDRVGAVRGLPGDEVGSRDGLLTVNGEWVGPLRIPGEAMGTVPPDRVFILVTNPMAANPRASDPSRTRYLDSRELGFIPREDVKAVLRTRLR
jgi:hypothetical protein